MCTAENVPRMIRVSVLPVPTLAAFVLLSPAFE
jgi:hypothetical protein